MARKSAARRMRNVGIDEEQQEEVQAEGRNSIPKDRRGKSPSETYRDGRGGRSATVKVKRFRRQSLRPMCYIAKRG